jgi:hypothetical protein
MFRFTRPVARKSRRERMRRAGWIGLSDGGQPIRCVIWDLSDDGARLAAQHSDDLPDVFALVLSADGNSHRFCRVVWRKGGHLGVRFIAADEARKLAEELPERRKPRVGPYMKLDRTAVAGATKKPITSYSKLDARTAHPRPSRAKPGPSPGSF